MAFNHKGTSTSAIVRLMDGKRIYLNFVFSMVFKCLLN